MIEVARMTCSKPYDFRNRELTTFKIRIASDIRNGLMDTLSFPIEEIYSSRKQTEYDLLSAVKYPERFFDKKNGKMVNPV